MGVLVQVLIGVASIFLAFLAGRTWEQVRLFRKYSYIRSFLRGSSELQIVVSHVEVPRISYEGDSHQQVRLNVPPNVLYMPMAEGRAVAELTSLLHRIERRLRIRLVVAANHDPTKPTLSIGGPSVNALTRRLLKAQFPDFSIDYPTTRRAKFGGHTFETLRDDNNSLIRDYGFIFVTQTNHGAPCLVLCGIRAYGSAMAAALLQRLPERSEAARMIAKRKKAIIVAEGRIDDLEITSVKFSLCHEATDELPLPARAG